MGVEDNTPDESKIDFSGIADAIGSLKKGAEEEAQSPDPTPTPKKETKKPKEDIVIRKKKDVPVEATPEEDLNLDTDLDIKASGDDEDLEDTGKEDIKPSDDESLNDDEGSDDDKDDDEFKVQEDKPGDSDNFKKLRKNRNELAKKAKNLSKENERLRKEAEELKGLTKYKDMFELTTSPEFFEKYGGHRQKIVSDAQSVAEIYGYDTESIASVFEAETIREAKQKLDEIVEDDSESQELATFIRDYYINKNQEAKALQDENPKDTYERLREEREARLAKEKELKIQQVNLAKKDTQKELEIALENGADKLWPGIYNQELSEYISSDLSDIHKNNTLKNFNTLFDYLHKNGLDVSFAGSKKLATFSADATVGAMANKIIPILLNKLNSYKKQIATQSKNSNPEFRQTPGRDKKADPVPQTKEEKALAAVTRVMSKTS